MENGELFRRLWEKLKEKRIAEPNQVHFIRNNKVVSCDYNSVSAPTDYMFCFINFIEQFTVHYRVWFHVTFYRRGNSLYDSYFISYICWSL